jgi:hypothetical integral membrane protein (TIGR02206 family)
MATGAAVPTNFVLFGPAHLTILSLVLLSAALLAFVQRKFVGQGKAVRIAFGIVLLADTAAWYAWMIAKGRFTFPGGLPLELCDLTLFLTIVALFTLNEWVFDVAYYTASAGAAMALLTPNLLEPFPSYPTVQFFVAHGLTVAGVLFLLWSGLVRPRRNSIVIAMIGVNAWACIAGAFDAIFKTNYMYLCQPPVNASLLSLMGPWPWYLVGGEGVALVLFLLLYLPFWVRDRKASNTAATGEAAETAIDFEVESADELEG